ncbi:MAG: class II aldolase/adducin family protein [Spirochaetaceae bacterium]|jgi:rhamnose utilization protein RhaD (predicted bifunctional aldolase and dehydrogenase)|nr:class II aldolase/adducin family protein [Spirochaetaceae bacterium]
MGIEELTALSRFYGADTDYVIAGGGNSSFKDHGTLWIKGSGAALGEISPGDFVALDRAKLAELWKLAGTGTPEEREAAVLAGMMAARKPGEEAKRPSVETLLHDLLDFAYVFHTHPALVNGLACSQDGEGALGDLFGSGVLWIPISDPGFVLALGVREKLEKQKRSGGKIPEIIFLQNHGVFVGAHETAGIRSLYDKIMNILRKKIKRFPDFGNPLPPDAVPGAGRGLEVLQNLSGARVVFSRNNEIAAVVKTPAAFAPVSSAYTPDHIVYAGSNPLFIEKGSDIEDAWKAHIKKTGRPPKIAALEGVGVFGIGDTKKAAALAAELFTDAVKIAVYAESFGGPRFMTDEKIAFINNWEAEQYRAALAR